MHTAVRDLQGAGRWFPGQPEALHEAVKGYIESASPAMLTSPLAAVVAPHAGYAYSGPVAGYAFHALQEHARQFGAPETVVVLGLSHRDHFEGLSVMEGSAIRSPLGETPLDRDIALRLAEHPLISLNYAPHLQEHSAENEVPFIQYALPDTNLVIGLFGDHDMRTLNAVVEELVKISRDRNILLVASTDMTHSPDYDYVCREDQHTMELFKNLDAKGLEQNWSYDHQCFCGIMPVLSAIAYAGEKGCREGHVLAYQNSGDIAPESKGNWVVGYMAGILSCGAHT
jgi:AmmeMemoRadiSam system protein B